MCSMSVRSGFRARITVDGDDRRPVGRAGPSAGQDGPPALVAPPPCVADVLAVPVPRGGRVLVFSDLRMVPGGNDVSREASRAIARAIEECRGPAVLVFAGDMFDLFRDGRPDLDGSLAAHPRLAAALGSFLGAPERRVVFLPGTRDAALAHDARVGRGHVRERVGVCAELRAGDRHRRRSTRRTRRARPSSRSVRGVHRPA